MPGARRRATAPTRSPATKRGDRPPPWRHRDHRGATLTPVPPNGDHQDTRSTPPLHRPTELPLPQTMAMQPQRPSRLATRPTAGRAAWGTHSLHRRHVLSPGLEIVLRVYQPLRAPVLSHNVFPEHRREVLLLTSRHLFVGELHALLRPFCDQGLPHHRRAGHAHGMMDLDVRLAPSPPFSRAGIARYAVNSSGA